MAEYLNTLLGRLEDATRQERALKRRITALRTQVTEELAGLALKGEVGPGAIRVSYVQPEPPIIRSPGWLDFVADRYPEHVVTQRAVRPAFDTFINTRAQAIWDGKAEPESDQEREALGYLGYGTPPTPYLRVRWVGGEEPSDG